MDTCKFVDLLFYWLLAEKQTLVLHSWTFEVLGGPKQNKTNTVTHK